MEHYSSYHQRRWILYGNEHLWNHSLTCPKSKHSFLKSWGNLLLTNSFIFSKLQERSLIDIYGKVTKHKLEENHTYKMLNDNNPVKRSYIIQGACYNPRYLLQPTIRVINFTEVWFDCLQIGTNDKMYKMKASLNLHFLLMAIRFVNKCHKVTDVKT